MDKSPRDIANEAESHVIALPQRAFSLLFSLALGRDHEAEFSSEARSSTESIDVIKRAHSYLSSRFQADFRQASGSFSEDLDTAQQSLGAIVAEFAGMLEDQSAEMTAPALVKMSTRIESQLEPAVSGFLAALFTDVVAYERSAARRAQDVDSSSLSEIDDITKKINFIAINASVEAARAGEVGKGFAVIAAEIKELSQQSKAAVDRIRTEIG